MAEASCIVWVRVKMSLSLCVTFSAMNCTKYGTSWWSPGSLRRLASAATRYSSLFSSRRALQIFSK